jgi:putative peptidoglycan lipid II flippase
MVQVVFLTRLMLPAQLFLCLGVIFSSAQVAHANFLVPCLGAAVSNCAIVLGGWLLAPRIGITGFAIGVLVGSFCGFFALQIIGLRQVNARFTPNLDFRHPGFRMFLRLAIPFMLALSVVVTDDWMLRWFGSFLPPASITWLAYGKMLARIPVSTVGYAVGLASFPHLARLHSEGNHQELNRALNQTAKALILLLAPVSAIAVALHSPLVYLVFSHTRLRGSDLEATASTLALFAVGIVGFGVQGLLARGFYATRDTVTPAVAGTAFTFASIPVYWYFGRHWKHLGLAAASSCVISLFAFVMFALLAHRTRNHEKWALLQFALKIAAASALCGAASYWLAGRIEPRTAWKSTMGELLLLSGVSFFGFGLYLVSLMALGIREVQGYVQNIVFRWRPGRTSWKADEEAVVVLETE